MKRRVDTGITILEPENKEDRRLLASMAALDAGLDVGMEGFHDKPAFNEVDAEEDVTTDAQADQAEQGLGQQEDRVGFCEVTYWSGDATRIVGRLVLQDGVVVAEGDDPLLRPLLQTPVFYGGRQLTPADGALFLRVLQENFKASALRVGVFVLQEGGGGSGHHGHEGRKGAIGGSLPDHRTLSYDVQAKKWTDPSGELPSHIAGLRIPPAWKEVVYDPDPSARVLVSGSDAKGRRQAIYSQEFVKHQSEAKFARIDELNRKFSEIQGEVTTDIRSGNKVEEASVLRLVMATGIRPGSDEDTGAAKKAYGATTLLGQHVVGDTPDSVRLKFVGKKGVDIDIPVEKGDVARDLLKRRKKAGPEGRLFDTDAGRLLDYTHSKDGGTFKTKDFRTLLATRQAMAEVKNVKKPRSEKEYKKAVRSVAQKVAEKLGNTPTVALQSYIHPSVFSGWVLR